MMDEARQIIRLELDGRWLAEDLGRALLCVSELYDLRLYLELLREDWREMDHFFFEMMQFGPRSSRWRKRLPHLGIVPWALGMSGGLPPLDEENLARMSRALGVEERLEIRRVSYASPGSVDLVGIGAVVGHLKDFILKLIERRDFNRHRELDDERAALENDRLRIENARNFVALGRDLGYSETEMRRLMVYVDDKQETLVHLVSQQKLRDVSIPDEKES